MSLAQQYTSEIAKGLQYLPIWLPIKTLTLGTVGTIQKNVFEPEGNLNGMGVPFTPSPSRSEGTMRYNSNDGVSIQFKAAGSAPVAGSALSTADAGVAVKFSRSNAVVFEASGCRIEAIADVGTLGRRLIELYGSGEWNKDYYVVTEVVKADVTTILISSSAGASLELKAGGDIHAASLSLASLEAQFSTASTAKMGYELVAKEGLTPLFKAWRVRGWFSTRWETAFMQSDEPPGEGEEAPDIPVFSQMTVDDLWPARRRRR